MELDIKYECKITLILNKILLTLNLINRKGRMSNLINDRFLFQKKNNLIPRISNKLKEKKVVVKNTF